MKDIVSLDKLLFLAGELKQAGKYNAGFDKMTPEAFITRMEIEGPDLIHDINSGRYKPMPASGFNVAKFSGGYRKLSRLTVTDAVIQKALLEKIEKDCDAFFSDFSFAYRRGMGMGKALTLFCEYASDYSFAAKIDIKDCFDSIDYDILSQALSRVVQDTKTAELLIKEAKMPVLIDGIINYRDRGILQGAPLSGIFCNIYLTALDRELEQKDFVFIRYADDITVFASTKEEAEEKLNTVAAFMSEALKLKVNMRKSRISESENLTFLGHKFIRDKIGNVILNENSFSVAAYYDWFSHRPANNRRSVDILSDGILRQKDYSAIFESETEREHIPIESIDRINIFSNVIFDSGFIEKAQRAGIYINIFSREYDYLGRFVPSGKLKDQKLIFEQLCAYNDAERRLELAKQFDLASVHNLRLNIRYYNKQRPSDDYQRALNALDRLFSKMKNCESYNELLLIEASARQLYYSCFDLFIIHSPFLFERRTKQPPMNEINSMISFGNTVLYNFIATEIYKSSLDIRVGYLHATNRREESLNLDIAEIFRPLIVDRVVFSLINRKEITPDCFYGEENGGIYLNEKGKKIFLRSFYDKLSDTVRIGNNSWSYAMLIDEEIRKLTVYFRTGAKYRAYRQVR